MIIVTPDATTDSLQAIHTLLRRADWADHPMAAPMRAQLAAALGSPRPACRLLALHALPVAFPDLNERAGALGRFVDHESDLDLLEVALQQLRTSLPNRLARPILTAASGPRAGGPALSDLAADPDPTRHDFRHTWVAAHLLSAHDDPTSQPAAVAGSWFADPAASPELFHTAVSVMRQGKAITYDADATILDQNFAYLRQAASRLHRDLVDRAHDPAVTQAALALCENLYFAVGANDTTNPDPPPTAQQSQRWYHAAADVLDDLTAVDEPRSCYYLLQTLEAVIDQQPARVFHAVAATIKPDGAFAHEDLGQQVAVRIIDRYLADHRQLFAQDPSALGELRGALETFTAVGWPAAIHLSYTLGDIFR